MNGNAETDARISIPFIREATDADLSRILVLYKTAGVSNSETFTLDEARCQLVRLGAYPYFKVFITQLDEVIVGTYELLIMDNLAKRGRKSGIVEDVAVHPAYQGQGIGRAMMDHAMERCRESGCYKLTLSSNFKRTDAHKFYEALGFEKHGYSFEVSPLHPNLVRAPTL